MKKNVLIGIVFLVALLVFISYVGNVRWGILTGYFNNIGWGEHIERVNHPMGDITVTVSQSDTLPAELVELQLIIESNHPDSLARAQEINNDATKKVYNSLVPALNESTDYLKTTDFRAGAQYSVNGQQRTITGYRAVHSLKLRTEQLNKLPELIKLALNSGVTRVEQVTFRLKNQHDACKSLMEPAVRLAEQRGTNLANLVGGRLIGLKRLDAQCSTRDYMPLLNYRIDTEHDGAMSVLANGRGAAISSGDVEAELQIKVQWYTE